MRAGHSGAISYVGKHLPRLTNRFPVSIPRFPVSIPRVHSQALCSFQTLVKAGLVRISAVPGVYLLTHLCLEIYLPSVVWTCYTFENNFEIKRLFTNYLKESCRRSSDERFSFKYFFLCIVFCERYHQNRQVDLMGTFNLAI